MALQMSRAVLRQQRTLLQRAGARNASTASEVASSAKEKTGEVASKAQEGLSRVTSSAGSAVSRVGGALGSIGGRTGRLVGFVNSLIPPTIYYSRVGLELGKLMFNGQKMALPSGATFQSYFNNALKVARNPSSISSSVPSANPQSLMNTLRNPNGAQLAAAGVVFAEVIGFFSLGEILGRLKIVGYRSDRVHHESAIG